jgi:hypothetical protein
MQVSALVVLDAALIALNPAFGQVGPKKPCIINPFLVFP